MDVDSFTGSVCRNKSLEMNIANVADDMQAIPDALIKRSAAVPLLEVDRFSVQKQYATVTNAGHHRQHTVAYSSGVA